MKLQFKTLLIVTTVLAAISLSPFAQDTPKNTTAPKPTPAPVRDGKAKEPPSTVIISADAVKGIMSVQKDAQLIQLQVENLTLKIQQAQADLKKLQEEAQKTGDVLKSTINAEAAKVGIPAELLPKYQISNGVDGAWILKREEAPAATPPTSPKN